MTDSLPALLAMLDAARALHERDGSDPRYCATCGTHNNPAGTYPVKWPCPTATALGATGRSEWTNTLGGPQPEEELCYEVRQPHAPDAWPCVRNDGHDGHHRDADGDTWQ